MKGQQKRRDVKRKRGGEEKRGVRECE